MIANKECYERGCACYDSRVDDEGIEVVAKHEWVGLTVVEVDKMIFLMGFPPDWTTENAIVRAIVRNLEAKLKEKNSDHRN